MSFTNSGASEVRIAGAVSTTSSTSARCPARSIRLAYRTATPNPGIAAASIGRATPACARRRPSRSTGPVLLEINSTGADATLLTTFLTDGDASDARRRRPDRDQRARTRPATSPPSSSATSGPRAPSALEPSCTIAFGPGDDRAACTPIRPLRDRAHARGRFDRRSPSLSARPARRAALDGGDADRRRRLVAAPTSRSTRRLASAAASGSSFSGAACSSSTRGELEDARHDDPFPPASSLRIDGAVEFLGLASASGSVDVAIRTATSSSRSRRDQPRPVHGAGGRRRRHLRETASCCGSPSRWTSTCFEIDQDRGQRRTAAEHDERRRTPRRRHRSQSGFRLQLTGEIKLLEVITPQAIVPDPGRRRAIEVGTAARRSRRPGLRHRQPVSGRATGSSPARVRRLLRPRDDVGVDGWINSARPLRHQAPRASSCSARAASGSSASSTFRVLPERGASPRSGPRSTLSASTSAEVTRACSASRSPASASAAEVDAARLGGKVDLIARSRCGSRSSSSRSRRR